MNGEHLSSAALGPQTAGHCPARRRRPAGARVGLLGDYILKSLLRFGGGRKLRYIGVERNQLWTVLSATAYKLVRMANLLRQPAQSAA
jgi:hypothetical protein